MWRRLRKGTVWIDKYRNSQRLIRVYDRCRPWTSTANILSLPVQFEPYYYHILFNSYKFVIAFLAITFLLLVISSWNFHDVCQRFLYNQEQNFSFIRQKTKISPIDPIIKIAQFSNVMSIDMTLQKWAIFIMGVYWEISHFLSNPTEISFLVI